MEWLFLAVVLVLAVFHTGFRRVLYWIGGVGATLGCLVVVLFATGVFH